MPRCCGLRVLTGKGMPFGLLNDDAPHRVPLGFLPRVLVDNTMLKNTVKRYFIEKDRTRQREVLQVCGGVVHREPEARDDYLPTRLKPPPPPPPPPNPPNPGACEHLQLQ